MKITNVDVFKINLPRDTWIWVCVETDGEPVGWGEITASGNDDFAAMAVHRLAKQIIGSDPRDIAGLTARMDPYEFPSKSAGRVSKTAWSGIDQALWDLLAKSLNVPLSQLLGARSSEPVALYANLNRGLRGDRSPDDLRSKGRDAALKGFRYVKCTPFDEIVPSSFEIDLHPAFERIEALAEVIPMSQIAIDCHQRFSETHLSQLFDLLNDKKPYWIEDPVCLTDASDLKRVRNEYRSVRWAGGETTLEMNELWPLLDHRAYDVLMPDVKHAGGVSGIKNMIPLIESRGLWVSLHNPSGPISTAHSAHLTRLCSHPLPLEFAFGVSEDRAHATFPQENISGGAYIFSDLPGIGLSPDPHFLKQYGEKWTAEGWMGRFEPSRPYR